MSRFVPRCASTMRSFQCELRRRRRNDGETQRWDVRHERPPGKDIQRRETEEKCRPNRCSVPEDFAYEQKEKWQRNGEEDYGLAASNPFMNTRKFVTNRGNKRQNGKFRTNITGRIASPIDLRIRETKTSFGKVACNGRDVALPPAPVINKGLVNQDEPHRDG